MTASTQSTPAQTTPADETRTLVIERDFAHSPAKLWRALTESPLLAQWLLNNDFAPEVGHTFQFRSEPVQGWNGIIDCKVLIVDPITRLSYTWGSMGMASVVLFTLIPSAAGTQLRMEQSGFGPNQDHAYKGATYGWQNFLGKLEIVLGGLD
jgi:uncharacterized protein YndB with AHSA1/START domain